MMKSKLKKFFKELRFYTFFLVVSIALAFCLRVFVIESIISVPTRSMEPAVMAGDRIIVSKQIPGPRIYRDIRQIRVNGKVMTKRFKGIRKVKRNNILFFNFPYTGEWDKIDMELNVFYLKRCIALPGDTFSIERGIYTVNNCTDSLGCIIMQQELGEKSQDDFSSGIWRSFPYDTVRYQWNIKNFGPLYVPEANATISLDTINFVLYKNLIEYETDKTLSIHEGFVYLDDDKIINYTFKLNYYFLAGDNIFDSQDSRYWGMLPEDCIIGKAVLVWSSIDPLTSKFRWNRFLKHII